MKKILSVFILISVTFCSDSSRTAITPNEYLYEVFEIIEEHSIRRDSVDFNIIKNLAYAKLKQADTIEDCYPIIQSILKGLGDSHSFFMPKEKVKKWKSTSKVKNINKIITFRGKLLNKDIGYIHMKGFSSGDSISIQQYADSLQNLIKSIDRENLEGWILDLRENTGGNCWPMLTGLGPLLGNGICGYFIDNNQKRYSWYYKDGESGIDASAKLKISMNPYKLNNELNPIAVLTGQKTVSSGEVVATAFHNKKNVRSFGQSTGGLSTGNGNYLLSDGSLIFLATTIFADREGIIFGGKIKPNELIKFSYHSIGLTDDLAIESSINWIYKN